MIRIAVIADPHIHDCAWIPQGSGLPGAVRSFAETAASTRVFNESIPAFRSALDRVVAKGIDIVLLVGDLTDDGQKPNICAALSIIKEYRRRHGVRILMTPGNHDFYALAGRPQSKTFLAADGAPVMVRSADCREAATLGTPEALPLLAGLGFTPEEGDLHWETPFGTDPGWHARRYEVSSPDGRARCAMIDSSYLVEPIEGLWVLSLDANVCVPRDGATDLQDPASFLDPTDGGWPAVLRHRAHLLPWMADVVTRARAKSKHLVAFSHYPALDPLGGTSAEEVALFGPTGLARRAPTAESADAFAATGIAVHFSGHLHVNDTAYHQTKRGRFVNIAVPSPVGYGPGLKIVKIDGRGLRIETVSLRQVAGYDAAFAAYRAEAARAAKPVPPAALVADHGQFLSRHLATLVHHRYLAHEWPQDMVDFVRAGVLSDLAACMGVSLPDAPNLPLSEFVEDWYRLRQAGELSHYDISQERLALYRRLCGEALRFRGDRLDARFATLLLMMGAYLKRRPNRDFSLLLPDLAIEDLAP